MHCVIMSVLLPRKEVLRDRVQDVGAENLGHKYLCKTFLKGIDTLSVRTSFVMGFVHFTIGMFMLIILNLFGLYKTEKKDEHMQMLATHLFT